MDPMLIALILAVFVRNGAEDLAFHLRGEESPRDARRAQRQKAAVNWAQHRGKRPPKRTGPVRQALRERWADAGVTATERRRARAKVRGPLALDRIERNEQRRADAKRERWQRRDQRREDRAEERQRRGTLIDRTLNRMSRPDRATWGEARTLPDLGERTAQWLEGDLDSQPGVVSGYGPDPETQDLIPTLAAANRAGYVTHGSQPGVAEEHGRQRAAVSGWTDAETAARIKEECEAAGLTVIDTPAGQKHDGVTVSEGKGDDGEWHPFTEFGPMPGSYYRQWWGRVCNPEAMAAVDGARDVTVVDPEWGRDDRLWPALRKALDPERSRCKRHLADRGFCNRPTDGSRYCPDCEADLVPGDEPEPNPAANHEPPTEQEPEPPEDDRPQPVADQPAQPEQPQPAAAEPKGTTMAVINPAEGGLESVDVFANTYAQIVNDLWSATETTAANFPPELAPGTNAALNTLLRDLDAMGTAGLEALRAAVAADKAVRDAYAATGNTASNKSVLVS